MIFTSRSCAIAFLGFIVLNTQLHSGKVSSADMFSDSPEEKDTVKTVANRIQVGAVSGALTIDGKMSDDFWQAADILTLNNAEADAFGKGGNVRVAVRGNYLVLGATMPEKERLVARSVGINSPWEREDLVACRLKYKSPLNGRTYFVTLAVNPLGAINLYAGDSHYYGSIGGDVINSQKRLIGIHGAVAVPADEFVNATGSRLDWVKDVISAASIGRNEWSAEVALPLKQIGQILFMSIERVRAARPDVPELSWYWPAREVRGFLELSEGNADSEPVHVPTVLPQNAVVQESNATETLMTKEISTLPGHAWREEEQKSLDVTGMLKKSLQSRIATFAEEEKIAWKKVNTIHDWEGFRDQRLASLKEWLGPFPERTPLRTRVTRRSNFGDGFVIENIVFESRPHLAVTANLYLPEKVSGKIPAVVVVHAHHAPKVQVELQDLGMTWARSGTAVLIMDQINGGERSQTQPWARESYHGRYTTGNQLYLAGESLIKWMAWDIMRGVDVLLERPFIDAERIVLLGGVAGGGDPAALTGNLDHRIAAVIPFCFGEASPEAHYLQGPRKYDNDTADPGWAHWETTRNLPHSVSEQFFPWFLCAAGAPRPFIFSFELAWPKTVEEEPVWARYKKVYDLYGARNYLAEVDGLGPFPGPGETNQISTYLRQRIDTILNRWFKLPLPKSEYHKMLAESDLMCLTPAAALEFKPEPVSSLAMQLASKRLADSRARRAGYVEVERKRMLRNDLEKKLGDIVPVTDPSVRALWSKQYSGFTMEASSIETEEGITLPVFLLIPGNSLKRRAAVIALAEGGKEGFFTERADELSSLLTKGITVCLPDLRGMGELNHLSSRGPRGMDLAANVLMTGSTMTGARLKDARTVLQWLSNRPDIDTTKIGVWGDSFAEPNAPDFSLDQSPGQKAGPVAQRQAEPLGPFLALLTALYEDHVSAVAASGGLISFMSVLEDRFSHVPQDVIVPGMVTVTDLGEIASLIAPRPVLLRKMVDGRNKLVPAERMDKEYGRRKSNVILRGNAGDEALATWLSKNLK